MKRNWRKWAARAILCGALLSSTQVYAATYTVKPGDTLQSLATRTGTSVKVWKISNHLSSTNIYAGSQLQQPLAYRVVYGDSLWKLSKRYHTTVHDIQQANGLKGSLILAGQVLQIPAGSALQKTDNRCSVSSQSGQAGKTIQAIATAYGPANIMWQWGGLTTTGKRVAQGMIAVDPKVIPLGSKVWISGYNDPNLPAGGFMATAEDTGGAIRGNRIDIFINAGDDQVRQFGMQPVTVTILK